MKEKKESVPFIKLIRTVKGCYLYDVNKNEVIHINEESYIYLENILMDQQVKCIPEEVRELEQKGFLSGKRAGRIEHSMTPFLPVLLQRRLQKVTLQLTQDCNFRCKYCHYTMNDGSQRVHSNKNMSFDMIKKGILFLREHSVDSPEVYIGFYGGEPLLKFEMLKEAVLYSQKVFHGKKINYTVTTNATLITEEIITFFERYEIQMVISLDGAKEIHDKNRVFANGHGTFESVIEKVEFIKKHHPAFFKLLSFNMVIDPQYDYGKIDDLFNQYPYLKKCTMTATIIDDISIHKNKYSKEYLSKVAYKEFLAYLCVLNRIPVKKLDPVTRSKAVGIQKTLSDLQPRDGLGESEAPGGPCVPGEVRLMLTVEGNFVVCERVNEISDCMILGNIEQGIDIEKANALLNVAQITQENCQNCWAFWGCDLCAKFSESQGKLSESQRLSQCKRSRSQFLNSIKEKILMTEAQETYGQRVNL